MCWIYISLSVTYIKFLDDDEYQMEGGARPKEKRSYFCRPCGIKHECPTNAKCERQKRARERPDSDAETVTGQPDSSGDETQPQPGCSETRKTPAKRTSKRNGDGVSWGIVGF